MNKNLTVFDFESYYTNILHDLLFEKESKNNSNQLGYTIFSAKECCIQYEKPTLCIKHVNYYDIQF